MLSKEVLILIGLVFLFLVLVSWTSTEKEAFTEKKYILQSYSELKKKWAEDYKQKKESQDEQERRLEHINKILNVLESKMERLRDNFIVQDSGETKVDPPCRSDDPLCIIPYKSEHKISHDHFSEHLA